MAARTCLFYFGAKFRRLTLHNGSDVGLFIGVWIVLELLNWSWLFSSVVLSICKRNWFKCSTNLAGLYIYFPSTSICRFSSSFDLTCRSALIVFQAALSLFALEIYSADTLCLRFLSFRSYLFFFSAIKVLSSSFPVHSYLLRAFRKYLLVIQLPYHNEFLTLHTFFSYFFTGTYDIY